MSIVSTYANKQGTEWTYEAIGLAASEILEAGESVSLPASQEGLRMTSKGTPYIPAFQFAHAMYLHSVLGYPVKKSWALARKFVNGKADRLSAKYVGSVADACLAINTLSAVEAKNFQDTELERAEAQLAKAAERVEKLRAKAQVKVA
jgi:hypothetical protein